MKNYKPPNEPSTKEFEKPQSKYAYSSSSDQSKENLKAKIRSYKDDPVSYIY